MLLEVEWRMLRQGHQLWQDRRCLYAYIDRPSHRILDIGKADYQTVRQRLHGPHKDQILNFCRQQLGVTQFGILHGHLG